MAQRMPCRISSPDDAEHRKHCRPPPPPLATKYRAKRASRFYRRANEYRAYRFESSTVDRDRYPSDPISPPRNASNSTRLNIPKRSKSWTLQLRRQDQRVALLHPAKSRSLKYNTFSLSHLFGVMNVQLTHLRSPRTSSLLPTCLCCRMDIQSEKAFSA